MLQDCQFLVERTKLERKYDGDLELALTRKLESQRIRWWPKGQVLDGGNASCKILETEASKDSKSAHEQKYLISVVSRQSLIQRKIRLLRGNLVENNWVSRDTKAPIQELGLG